MLTETFVVRIWANDPQNSAVITVPWEWSQSDPYAVSLILPDQPDGKPCIWTVSRELLGMAFTDSDESFVIGDGDVQIYFSNETYIIKLTGMNGFSVFLSHNRQAVKNFVHNLPNIEFKIDDSELYAWLDSGS